MEDIVNIRNKNTKAILQVKRSELPSYGLPTDYLSVLDAQLSLAKKGGVDFKKLNQEDPQAAEFISSNKGFQKEVRNNLDKKAQNVLEIMDAGKSGKLNGQAYKDALNAASSDYLATKGFAEGGKALTGPELAVLGGQTPVIRIKGQSWLDRIFGNIPPQTGEVTDDDKTLRRKMLIAQKVARGEKIDYNQIQNPSGGIKPNDLNAVGQFGKNFVNNSIGIVNDALRLNSEVQQGVDGDKSPSVNAVDAAKKTALMGLKVAGGIPGGMISNVNETLGHPFQGNPSDILQRIGQHAYEKPVDTLLTAAPFLKAAPKFSPVKAVSSTIKAPAAVGGKVVEAVGKTDKGKRFGEGLKSYAVNSSEVVSPGEKKFIAMNENLDQARPLSKTRLDWGIDEKMTSRGKIQKTSNAIAHQGNEIGKVLKKSGETFEAGELSKELGDYLRSRYPHNEHVIQDIEAEFSKLGEFKMGQDQTSQIIPIEKVHEGKVGLDKLGLKYLGIGGEAGSLGKAIVKDGVKFIQDKIKAKVPASISPFREYGNLMQIMEELPNPQGFSFSNTLKSGSGAVRSVILRKNQALYNLGKGLSPEKRAVFEKALDDLESPSKGASAQKSVPPSAKPVDNEILNKIFSGKGAAQSARMKDDFKYEPPVRTLKFDRRAPHGSPRLTSQARKDLEKIIDAAKKKRYK